jgi:hypothetical protein
VSASKMISYSFSFNVMVKFICYKIREKTKV